MLATYATLKSLSDEKKYQGPYQILREFIRYIITSDSLYSFSAIEMKNRLSMHFNFCYSARDGALDVVTISGVIKDAVPGTKPLYIHTRSYTDAIDNDRSHPHHRQRWRGELGPSDVIEQYPS